MSTSRGRLRRADCSAAGMRRRRRGRGFSYLDAGGEPIDDEETLERIAGLAIPPAWRDVWICPDPLGHIQATGVDAAGRKQYLYHPRWHARRAERKFARVRRMGRLLPDLRRAVGRDLRREGMPRERALACAVRLLDLGFFRIGGEGYAEENESYGLATILREHVTVGEREVVFDFPAKGGQRRVQSIRDPAARRAIAMMRRRRSGPDDLLAYRSGGRWHDLRSEDINEYIQAAIGEEFSAKDFRTWHGTVLAAVELARAEPPASKAAERREIAAAVERVAEALGNTPAVCRSSYIDPRVLDRFRAGETLGLDGIPAGRRPGNAARARIERAVLELISPADR